MARLIDADTLKQTFQQWANVPEYNEAERNIIRAAIITVENAPTVDAAPVVHGRWEFCGDDDIVCSECGARYYKKWLLQSFYTGPGSDRMDGFGCCPYCGALMDGGKDDE